ncbi:MAG: hypothetical protein KDK90_27805 [Leptospiraceae bacterium]|nr:hypothetical protein [Leptospiraceae bacterium]
MKIFVYCNLLIVQLLFLANCSAAQFRAEFDKHDGFWNWMKGSPGVKGRSGTKYIDPMLEPVDGQIVDERHPYYLWLRTPEIIFNPQGGIYYPDMIIKVREKFYNTADLSSIKDESLKRSILASRSMLFRGKEAGLIEYLIPYREILAGANDDGDPCIPVFYCVFSPFFILIGLPERLIFYPIHDVIKTLMLPVAAVYYTVKAFDDNDEEEPEK